MIYEAISEENLKYYEDFIPGQYRHFAFFPGEMILGAAAEEEDIKFAMTDDAAIKETKDSEVVPAGIILFNIFDPQTLNIDWLFVDEPFREQSIATDLLGAAFEMSKRAELKYIRARAFNEDTESFFIRRGFSKTGSQHREWFLELKDVKDIAMPSEDNTLMAGSIKHLPREVVADVIDRFTDDDICFPLIPGLVDPDHSFICAKGKEIVGSLFAQKVEDVYCLAAFKGNENAKKTLFAHYLLSFQDNTENAYLHIRSFLDENDNFFSKMITKAECMTYQVLTAYPDSMQNAVEAVEKAMLQEEEANEADESFPKRLVVTDVEYYSGMIIDEEEN
ncbi:MAG: GNAT family N-acetyltransferase [Butyrivibrio sp.]|nr:GNAT family N-acetyltransferase [Butyrivibrio sp.]